MKKNILLSCAVLCWIAVGCRTDDAPTALSDGQVEVRLTNGDSRTLLPTAADLYYTLVFTSGATQVNTSIEPGGELTKTVTLKPGTWKLSVNGYADADDTEAAVVTGEALGINAAAGALVVVTVELTGTQSGSGVARFSLKFPQAAASATLTFTPYGGGTPVSANLLDDQTYAVSTDAGIVSSSGDIALSSGYYKALFLAKGTDAHIARRGTVHIFDGLRTLIEWAFAETDFVEAPNKTALTELLDEAGAAKAGIDIKADETKSSDVNVGTSWVTETEAATLEAVIAAAQGVVDDTSADLEEVLAAESALAQAKAAYVSAIKEGTKPVAVDKSALISAIDEAKGSKSGVLIDTAPENVANGVVFVTQTVMDTFNAAISAAETVNANTATQAGVDEAVTTLNAAIGTFNAAKRTGTNTGITAANKTELDAALMTANTAADSAEVATAADKVLTGRKWVTAAEMGALNTAITSAESVSQDGSATQAAVNEAVTALNAAITTFNAAKKDGTKVPVTFSGLTANGSVSATTTVLTLTFNKDVPGLTAENIALTGTATVAKGTLTKAADTTGQYELGVTVTAGGSVIATVTKDGYEFSSAQSVTVYYYAVVKTALKEAIGTANTAKDKVEIATAANEVLTGSEWVTQSVMDALTAAIASAESVFQDGSATQAEVDEAEAALNTAITTFNAAKEDGTLVITVTVSGPTTVMATKSITLAAVVTPTSLSQEVAWSVQNGSGTADIDSNGTLTAGTVGTVTVSARVADLGVESSAYVVTITPYERLAWWNFQTLPAGWTNDTNGPSNAIYRDVNDELDMELLASKRSQKINTTSATPTGADTFSNGFYQPGGSGDSAKIEQVQGPFTIILNYASNTGDINGRRPSIKIGSTTYDNGTPSKATSDPQTYSHTYTGTDTVDITITGTGNPGRIYDIIIKDPVSDLPITIGFTDKGAGAFSQENFTLSRSEANSNPKTKAITLVGTWDSVQWYVDGNPKGTGNAISIDAAKYTLGGHTLNVEVVKDGIPWSKGTKFSVTE